MDGSTHRSDADRELSELLERAYGPDPDIDVDPAALARLRELGAAHGADVESRTNYSLTMVSAGGGDARPTVAIADAASAPHRAAPESSGPGTPPTTGAVKSGWMRSLWRRARATSWSRLLWAAGALFAIAAVVATVLLVSVPRADATLHQTAAEPDTHILRLVARNAPWLEINADLRAYGSYLGLEIWSGTDVFDSPCLIAVNRANDTLSEARCAPAAAELILDVASFGDDFDGLPGDGIVRFIHRDDTVDAYVHLMPRRD